jgi:hypothetical protein
MHKLDCPGGYDPTQSSLAVLLDRHSFNGISATMLFTLLARVCRLARIHALKDLFLLLPGGPAGLHGKTMGDFLGAGS